MLVIQDVWLCYHLDFLPLRIHWLQGFPPLQCVHPHFPVIGDLSVVVIVFGHVVVEMAGPGY